MSAIAVVQVGILVIFAVCYIALIWWHRQKGGDNI